MSRRCELHCILLQQCAGGPALTSEEGLSNNRSETLLASNSCCENQAATCLPPAPSTATCNEQHGGTRQEARGHRQHLDEGQAHQQQGSRGGNCLKQQAELCSKRTPRERQQPTRVSFLHHAMDHQETRIVQQQGLQPWGLSPPHMMIGLMQTKYCETETKQCSPRKKPTGVA